MIKFENKGKWVRQIAESAELDSPENEEMALDLDESAQVNEAKVNMSKLKNEIQNAINKYFKNDKDLLEYVYVETKKGNFGRDILEVRAELGYNSMQKLAEYLDKIVQKYDKYAYFDMENAGIMSAVFESAQVNEDNPYEEEWHEHVNGVKGSFMKHLANAFQQADMNNLRKLHSAFPEISKKFWLWKTVGEKEKP